MGETLVVPEGTWIIIMTREAFENMFLKDASCSYINYRLVGRQVLGLGVEGMPKELDLVHY